MLLAREIIVQIDVICVFIYHIQRIITLYIMFIDEITKQTFFFRNGDRYDGEWRNDERVSIFALLTANILICSNVSLISLSV